MATTSDTIIYLLDQLTQLGPRIRTRKMFGEYALYCDGKVVALICDNQVYLKQTTSSRTILGPNYQLGTAYPGAKNSYLLGDDVLENKAAFATLLSQVASDLPNPKPKKS